jgi:hypothetical protein
VAFDPTPLYDGSFDGVGFCEGADAGGRFASIGAETNEERVLTYPGSDDVDYIDLGDRPVDFEIKALVTETNKDALAARRKSTHTLICSQAAYSFSAYLRSVDAVYVANQGCYEVTMAFRRA